MKQKETLLNTMELKDFQLCFWEIGEEHVGTSFETPLERICIWNGMMELKTLN